MKILHVLDHSIPLASGYTFRTRAILREQRRIGWETFHLTGPKQGSPSDTEETVDGLVFQRTARRPTWTDRLPGLEHWNVVRAIERRLEPLARQLRPDLLHAHSPALNGLAALRVARRLKLPLVYEVRAFWEDAAVDHGTASEGGLRYRATRALETHVLRHADAVTTICDGLRQDIVERGIPLPRVTVIPNAVDLQELGTPGAPDTELATRLGITGKRVLGFIGSFYTYEGLTLAIEALPRIRDQHDAVLLLVGGGPQEADLKRLVAARGLSDHVVFTGRVPHAEVARYYSLVEVLLYPRLPMRLTELVTPLKPLEAMAQRKLFVASDVGGHRELIRDRETGILFRSGDAAALAAAVDDLLSAPEIAERLRSNGARFVAEQRNWPVSVARYRPVYAAAVGRAV
ncbi:MAG: glycosyltransferase, exosortase A system-associated [Gammaproteobacteria bacterium]|nr:glycosyltransferase, exosortase A system-associated [Gammaproteobacteria bacterium]